MQEGGGGGEGHIFWMEAWLASLLQDSVLLLCVMCMI